MQPEMTVEPPSPLAAPGQPYRFMREEDVVPLVARLLRDQRDTDAIERLISLCHPVAMRIARTYVREEEDRADVVQEALIQLSRRLPQLRDAGAFPAWFLTLTRNCCRQWLRREQTRRPSDHESLTVADLAALPDPGGDLAVAHLSTTDHAGRLLQLLPDRERAVAISFYLHDRSYAQIGRQLGLTTRAVEGVLYRATSRLRVLAAQCHDDPRQLERWCPLCGAHRLSGHLELGASAALPLHLRASCPRCSPGRYWLVSLPLPFARYRSLDDAYIQGSAVFGRTARSLRHSPAPLCAECGASMTQTWHDELHEIVWECRGCGAEIHAGALTVAATIPTWRAFWRAAPRLHLVSQRSVSNARLLHTEAVFWDPEAGRAATLTFARDTLRACSLEIHHP